MGILTTNAANCPYCKTPVYYTTSDTDHAKLKTEHPETPVAYIPTIDMGTWRPATEVRIGNRVARISPSHLASLEVTPIMCDGCGKIYFAYWDCNNVAAFKHYEEFVRPTNPPKNKDDKGVVPTWQMVGHPSKDFCDQVKSTKNPMVRAAVVRRLLDAGIDLLPLRGLEQGPTPNG